MKYDFKLDTQETNSSHTKLLHRVADGNRVLELGCATGYLSEQLVRQKNCTVVGVDCDQDALKKAAQFCSEVYLADLDHENWHEPLLEHSFDVVLCADVVEHLKNPQRMLSTVKALLKPDGCLLLSVPNFAHGSIRLELLQGHFDYEQMGLMDETHLHFYTREGLLNLLMASGFAAYDIDYTLHDLADEAITEHLAALGLTPSEQTLELFHQPSAAAYQFIIEARPAHDDVTAHRIPPLTPKPLASSNLTYGQKQARIEHLEQLITDLNSKLEQQQIHAANLRKELDATYETLEHLKIENRDAAIHNSNRQQHIETLTQNVRDMELALTKTQSQADLLHAEKQNLLLRLDIVQTEKNESLRIIAELSAKLDNLSAALDQSHIEKTLLQTRIEQSELQKQALQQVLDRIHNKPLMRFYGSFKRLVRGSKPDPLPATSATVPKTPEINDYREWLNRYGNLSPADLDLIEQDLRNSGDWPEIAVIMPVYNTEIRWLKQAVDSVIEQVYPYWHLHIVDDASTHADVRVFLNQLPTQDNRIKVIFRERNGHISEASNTALEQVQSDFMALLDHDDQLALEALYCIAKAIKQYPEAALWYSDEDKISETGERSAPYFKPDWNPDLLLAHNYICHLGCYRTDRVRALGGFRKDFDGAQDYDLTLRYVEGLESKQIIHIPRVLYHWRTIANSTATGIEAKPYAAEAALKAMKSAMERTGQAAKVEFHECLPGALRVRFDLPEPAPKVSIIIPTRNGYQLLSRCLDSLRALTDYPDYELIIIDNGSDEPLALWYLQQLTSEPSVTIIRDDSPFNYAALNNRAAKQAKGEILALLNNDLEIVESDWLKEMVALAVRPGTGAVGAELWYPDDSLQHGGVITGLGGVAGHSHKHFPKSHPGYCGRLLLTQNLSAVTAACMVLRKQVFDEVGGFDDKNLTVAFNDVDLCLRIQEAGYRNIWTPYARMYHHESATRGSDDSGEKVVRFQGEIAYMKQRWGESLLNDPAYNPNLTLDREDFSLSWPPRLTLSQLGACRS